MNGALIRALACCLALSTLSACSSGQSARPQSSTHHHLPQAGWQRNGTHHWQLCQCGETVNLAPHAPDETSVCPQCGSCIWDHGSEIEAATFDSNGDPLLVSIYSTQGELLCETRYQREYTDQGFLLRELCFENDILFHEDVYSYFPDEEGLLSSMTSRCQDGSSTLRQYDRSGNPVLIQEITPEGMVSYESVSEYFHDAQGRSFLSQCCERREDGSTCLARYNQYGDITFHEQTDRDGALIYRESFEYGYNTQGQRLWMKEYENGRLAREIPAYICTFDGYETVSSPKQIIEYFQAGGWLISDYDARMELLRETWYNEDGSLFLILNYTYEYGADGHYDSISIYEFDRLMTHTRYATTSEGVNYPHTETFYDENGTTRVCRYDQNGELLSRTEYAP